VTYYSNILAIEISNSKEKNRNFISNSKCVNMKEVIVKRKKLNLKLNI
jgi:hypothetical protein